MDNNNKIRFTKPFMPPRGEYENYLKGIWEREYITNNGPLVQKLEQKLIDYLCVSNLLYVSNGTVALQIAIKALGLKGEIITTPFSYIATTSSIVWEGCEPVFVDIDPGTLNIDPNLIEGAITDKTTGIVATHVFGNPCDIEAIQQIADLHGLKVIYDGAHCFGTKYKGKCVFECGDVSTASFHATKLFHTIEGGAVFSSDDKLMKRMAYMRNFGHDGFGKFNGVGINGKNSEFHAVMGLCNLRYIEKILDIRRKQCEYYDKLLEEISLEKQSIEPDTDYNYSYYPVIFRNEEETLECIKRLEENEISSRRYFYPSLSNLSYVKGNCKKSNDIASRILCLPLYHNMTTQDQEKVANILISEYLNLC